VECFPANSCTWSQGTLHRLHFSQALIAALMAITFACRDFSCHRGANRVSNSILNAMVKWKLDTLRSGKCSNDSTNHSSLEGFYGFPHFPPVSSYFRRILDS
jgi:hypothetical protein